MDTFTWQVVATFAAVAGATFVGWQTVGIAKGQAATAHAAMKIAEAQAQTSRLAQRAALFDKRYKVYSNLQTFIELGLTGDAYKIVDLNKELGFSLNQARFLFPDTVYGEIDRTVQIVDDYMVARLSRNENEDGSEKADLRVMRAGVRERLQQLSTNMGDEMNLFHKGS